MAGADKKISDLTAALSLQLSDIFPLVNGGETKKATFDALKKLLEKNAIGGGTIAVPAGAGLSNSDAGKLIQLKAGEAFVANRDTPFLPQAGQWKFTFTAAPTPPEPTEFYVEFTAPPLDGEFLIIGSTQFVFKPTSAGKNFVEIGATTQDCAQNLHNKLQSSRYYTNYFTSTLDLPNSKVLIKFNGLYNQTMGKPNTADHSLFAPPIGSNVFESCSNSINWGASISGSDTWLINGGGINQTFCDGFIRLSLFDIMNPISAVAGTQLFGLKWAADEFEFAQNFEAAVNSIWGSVVSAVRTGAEVVVTALVEPNDQEKSDITLQNDNFLSFVQLETLQFNLGTYPDFIAASIIGTLLFVDAGQAYISTAPMQKVKLTGTENSIDFINEVTTSTLFKKILVPANNGEVETALSFFASLPGNPSPDIRTFVALRSNMMISKSQAAPGDYVICERVSAVEIILLSNITGG